MRLGLAARGGRQECSRKQAIVKKSVEVGEPGQSLSEALPLEQANHTNRKMGHMELKGEVSRRSTFSP